MSLARRHRHFWSYLLDLRFGFRPIFCFEVVLKDLHHHVVEFRARIVCLHAELATRELVEPAPIIASHGDAFRLTGVIGFNNFAKSCIFCYSMKIIEQPA
jgi:hypothetical protein